MAAGRIYRCGSCGLRLEAWDEGEPYYFDERGEKRHAHHPSPERERCVGTESPHLCMDCAAEFLAGDADAPPACPACGSSRVLWTWLLEGRACPRCRTGAFETASEMIS